MVELIDVGRRNCGSARHFLYGGYKQRDGAHVRVSAEHAHQVEHPTALDHRQRMHDLINRWLAGIALRCADRAQ
jgi:hypothetical protein